MIELDVSNNIIKPIIKISIIINAKKLNWDIHIDNDKITLTKKINDLTELDKNTKQLLHKLINI
jgi:hypothetical protein